MKKSTRVITDLLNFLKGEKIDENDTELNILNKSQRTAFEKKPDFFRILSTIRNYLFI